VRLAGSAEPMARSIACILLADLWQQDRQHVLDRAIQLATDPDWEVREWAAGIFGAALDRDFVGEYPTMRALVSHPEPGVRRAIALAAMRAADTDSPQRAQPLIDLLEPLLTDRDDYVRKNLGPFAIGDGLMRAYPDATLDALAAWALRDDEITRWNVAMACGSGAARRHQEHILPILATLANDDRRLVLQAVRTARRRLSPAT
jgi:HEAT repeat protein